MALKGTVLEGILSNRESPFARNKGFSERFDKVFQDSGYDTRATEVPSGTTVLWDVRAIYGFFVWLFNNAQAEDIELQLFFSYKNFDKVTDLSDELDWVEAVDSSDVPLIGTLLNNEQEELEIARISSRVTAVRLDIDSTTDVTLEGTFSAV